MKKSQCNYLIYNVNLMEKRVIVLKKGRVISDEEKGGYKDED